MDPSEVGPTVETLQESSYKVIVELGSTLSGAYRNMVYSKWLRRFRFGNDYIKLIDSDAYYQAYTSYITSILNREYTVVRLAILTDDPDVVLGFSVSEKKTLHFCVVNPFNRKQGIAKSLVPFEVEVITHLTKTGLTIWNNKMPKAIFNPFQEEQK
jgi:hypothetical protein